MTCGVYRIVNTENSKFYVGGSKDIESRFRTHRRHLRRGDHWNEHLQSAWDKYGEDSFRFEVAEECEANEVHDTEQEHLDPLFDMPASRRREVSYNQNPNSAAPYMPGFWEGREHDDETREKISEARQKHFDSLSEEEWNEYRRKISESWEGLSEQERFYRSAYGEKAPAAKLTADDAKEIRERYECEAVSYGDLADEYPVSKSAIAQIVRRETWKHVS